MKITAVAPSNIAFIKYWGKKNETLHLPENGSISMNLSNLLTTTTVDFNKNYKEDFVLIDKKNDFKQNKKVIDHLNRIRVLAHINYKAKVISENNFPASIGLSSSASSFAALTLAACTAAGLNFSEKELSIIARQGSGSACRSIPNGFVEWICGNSNKSSYAISIFPSNHWDIVDLVVLGNNEKKDISSTDGQKIARSSPFFPVRIINIYKKINMLKKHIKEKNFTAFGNLIEAEALELHAIMLTSTPPLIYWLPNTVQIIKAVQNFRKEGTEVYFSINTGQTVHVICQKKDIEKVFNMLSKIKEVDKIIVNYPSKGAQLTKNHLF